MKASSKKNAIDLPLPSDSADAADAAAPVAAGEEERQSEPEESGGNNNKNKEEGEGEDAEEEEQEEEEEEEGEEEDDDEEEKEEAPKLEEGFYEIEDIRKKRVRNAQIQYLIKWRGWPESANTWEPLDNIRSCADMIEVFEERSSKSSRKRKRKYGRPHHTTTATARKKRSGPVPLAVPPAKPLLQGNGNGNFDSSKDEMKVTEDGEEEEANPTEGEGEGNTRTTEEENTAQVAAAGCITIQPNGTSRDDDGSMEDGSSKIDGTQPLHGAKKRKSGCVRRFKQESALPPKQDDGDEKLGSEDVDSTQDDNSGDGHKLDDSANPPHITKILKPVRYCASITDDVQQVSITFKALRSDGTEVLVDDKDLKVNNPLLLITYYEQHLRYSPHT